MDTQEFRQAMGTFATGITVVTSKLGDHTHGMTVNAFMSVSLDPKLITIALDHKTKFYQHANKLERIGVSILREEQEEVSRIFAKQLKKSYNDFSELDGIPVIGNALTTLACTVVNTVQAGDHLLVIAEVNDMVVTDGKPLLYYHSAYRTIME
ncbi:flavin reductase family protein [Gracilibacillus alcaliphilus]|uniref:flavin reductase family protein n=1 Tax=Gracilibacillus alcaliphilus TaxID=1401441 RepID=UPI00195A1114|nr:flavin reductase family protein [Gracilibacillus alcaliphilus]MBM7677646.1 flavin reductase (DIM6/NTAB) family NADH-FMN oxidoreductase RutF [Gracilibacillus alcaliphilus]